MKGLIPKAVSSKVDVHKAEFFMIVTSGTPRFFSYVQKSYFTMVILKLWGVTPWEPNDSLTEIT